MIVLSRDLHGGPPVTSRWSFGESGRASGGQELRKAKTECSINCTRDRGRSQGDHAAGSTGGETGRESLYTSQTSPQAEIVTNEASSVVATIRLFRRYRDSAV